MNKLEKLVISGVGAITPLFAKLFVDYMKGTPECSASEVISKGFPKSTYLWTIPVSKTKAE